MSGAFVFPTDETGEELTDDVATADETFDTPRHEPNAAPDDDDDLDDDDLNESDLLGISTRSEPKPLPPREKIRLSGVFDAVEKPPPGGRRSPTRAGPGDREGSARRVSVSFAADRDMGSISRRSRPSVAASPAAPPQPPRQRREDSLMSLAGLDGVASASGSPSASARTPFDAYMSTLETSLHQAQAAMSSRRRSSIGAGIDARRPSAALLESKLGMSFGLDSRRGSRRPSEAASEAKSASSYDPFSDSESEEDVTDVHVIESMGRYDVAYRQLEVWRVIMRLCDRQMRRLKRAAIPSLFVAEICGRMFITHVAARYFTEFMDRVLLREMRLRTKHLQAEAAARQVLVEADRQWRAILAARQRALAPAPPPRPVAPGPPVPAVLRYEHYVSACMSHDASDVDATRYRLPSDAHHTPGPQRRSIVLANVGSSPSAANCVGVVTSPHFLPALSPRQRRFSSIGSSPRACCDTSGTLSSVCYFSAARQVPPMARRSPRSYAGTSTVGIIPHPPPRFLSASPLDF